ncbi:Inositol-pentakisphosphate 2-kinase family protein [Striga hermonthica]|uniref:Inositol-pentakisphosphate 2-kinase n=1 Tax=Striga hermonthica TaxID=68872 RepID=A0A9N7N1E3_STRHE|nr:Inositol-pentakisphosphate 2-kinase family protein [Striga hermonthica]
MNNLLDASQSPSYVVERAFQDGIKHVIVAKDGMHTKHFVELVAETVVKSGLLNELLQVQKLDAFDVVSKPCMGEKLKVVSDYLISATGKDLSLMISFRTRRNSDPASHHVVFLESTNQAFDYKASLIDLDMKPLKKMKHYYELDQ